MKRFRWDRAKNESLKASRGVSFEEIVLLIEQGAVISAEAHPNPARYPTQKILEILVGDYVFLVPFVESEQEIFLKTIIPSRKATKRYRTRRKI